MDEDVSNPIDAKLLNSALAGVGGQLAEQPEPAKTGELNSPATTTARPPSESEARHQDELAELVGSLDQLVGPSGDS